MLRVSDPIEHRISLALHVRGPLLVGNGFRCPGEVVEQELDVLRGCVVGAEYDRVGQRIHVRVAVHVAHAASSPSTMRNSWSSESETNSTNARKSLSSHISCRMTRLLVSMTLPLRMTM